MTDSAALRYPEPAPIADDLGVEPIPAPDVDPIAQFAHLVPALWRTMKRASRADGKLPPNESQVTILRMLMLHGDLTPAQLSEHLRIARPTVSNLLKDLVATGLVERRIADHDARSVLISATPDGRHVLEAFRDDRAALLRAALGRMPENEQDDLRSIMPALRHLLRQLEVVADESDLPSPESD
jgi:DNA-binding MarR family transcriptional regulator